MGWATATALTIMATSERPPSARRADSDNFDMKNSSQKKTEDGCMVETQR
jgi:hypothetical protein